MNKLIAMGAAAMLLLAGHANAAGDAAAGKAKAAACAACHQADGNSVNPEWPKIAGQHAGYLEKQLHDFKQGTERNNALMTGQVAALTDEDMANLAAFFASQETAIGSADEAKLALGEQIYRAGNPETGLPACMACHGPDGAGNGAAKFPSVSGQHTVYVVNQLKAFASGERSNDLNRMMRDVAAKMSAEEMEAVASYMQGLH